MIGPEDVALKDVIILSGNLRSTALSQQLSRAMLDLPAEQDMTLLQHWCGQVSELADATGHAPGCRVLVDGRSPLPRSVGNPQLVMVEHDPVGYRGTGGVLRDAVEGYDDADRILAVFGPQLLRERLGVLVEQLAAASGDVVLFRDGQRSPSGLMLIRVGALRTIKQVGFVDFKEQALPRIAASHAVRVVDRAEPVSWPIRTLGDYIEALRGHHLRDDRTGSVGGPFAERWDSSFVLTEHGAEIASDAHLHDAVVLSEGRVGKGALVARSVVCAEGVVEPGRTVVEQVVRPSRSREISQ